MLQTLAIDSWLLLVVLWGAGFALQFVIFAPISIWPAAYVCLVPWILVVGCCSSARRVYVASYLLGLAFFLARLTWIYPITVEGYVALTAYLAVYYPLMACPIRHAVRRRSMPLVLAVPIIWVGGEYMRALVIDGFPWFFLAHSQHRLLSVIQISDLVGAYGVSFLVAMINGAIADALLAWLRNRGRPAAVGGRRYARGSLVAAAVCLLATLVYGQVQLRRDTSSPGPRIAVIQGNYPHPLRPIGPDVSSRTKADRYFKLIQDAATLRPDLFLLPETPWSMVLNRTFLQADPADHPDVVWSRECYDRLQGFATKNDAVLVTGAMSRELTPLNRLAEEWNFNSAFVLRPDGSPPDRYDKVHTVYFGETVPFRFGRFRFLYVWFNSLSPFGEGRFEYSLTPGREFKVFEMATRSQNGRRYRFGIPICYEDVMPYIGRRFAIGPDGRKRVDFLLNISNDGWFLHSGELPQHLAICAFRAVENRVGIARAVNTGISGFIDADGRIHDLVADGAGRVCGPDIDGWRVASIDVDSRCSLYSRTGDVFARLCFLLWGAVYVDYLIVRIRGNRADRKRTLDGSESACA